MSRSSRKENQGDKAADAVGFLRDRALITDVGGQPALTSKGEKFLNHFNEQSSNSSLGPASDDGLNSAGETGQP
jgi:chromosome segregation and condensation protein ScpB